MLELFFLILCLLSPPQTYACGKSLGWAEQSQTSDSNAPAWFKRFLENFMIFGGCLAVRSQRPNIILPLTTSSEQADSDVCVCVCHSGVDSIIQMKFVYYSIFIICPVSSWSRSECVYNNPR